MPDIGDRGEKVIAAPPHGLADGSVWRPGETDVSIRPGWFYHAAEDARVKRVDELVQLYFTSVGRNSKLLLNVPPTRDGVLHDTDVARLVGMRAAREALFAHPLTLRENRWRADGPRAGVRTIVLRTPQSLSLLDLGEVIEHGPVAYTHLTLPTNKEV